MDQVFNNQKSNGKRGMWFKTLRNGQRKQVKSVSRGMMQGSIHRAPKGQSIGTDCIPTRPHSLHSQPLSKLKAVGMLISSQLSSQAKLRLPPSTTKNLFASILLAFLPACFPYSTHNYRPRPHPAPSLQVLHILNLEVLLCTPRS